MDMQTLERANKIKKQLTNIERAIEEISEASVDDNWLCISTFSDGSGKICDLDNCGVGEDVITSINDILHRKKQDLENLFANL